MKTYLFDFDGTLVDSMPSYISAILRILDENHIPYGEDLVKAITPLGTIGTAKYFIQLGLAMSVEDIVELMKKYMLDAYFYHIPAKSNVIGILKEREVKGVSLNVLIASLHITLDACLKRLEMYDLFDKVWSCDDFGTTKADPNIYKMERKKQGVTVQEVLFLDDNLKRPHRKESRYAGLWCV